MLPLAPKTRVVSMRNGNKDFDVRIDRETKWGNRFYMKKDTVAERKRVCEEHAIDLWVKIYAGVITLSHLNALYGLKLGCWCSPKQCHGDELVKAVEWAHDTICKYERIKLNYRKRRNAQRKKDKNSRVKKKVSRKQSKPKSS